MEDENKIHPVVKLMLARMESHPEEFVSAGRWVEVMNYLDAASGPERSLISAGYRKLFSPARTRLRWTNSATAKTTGSRGFTPHWETLAPPTPIPFSTSKK